MMVTQPIQLQPEHVKISAGTTLAVWLARKLARLLLLVVRSPAKLAAVLPLAAVWWLAHTATWLAVGFALVALAVTGAWAMQFPDSYRRHVAGRIRGTWRSLYVYRWRWSTALKRCVDIKSWHEAPLLLRTHSTQTADQLRIRMVAGQRLEDYTEKADRLAQTFKALGCRIRAVPNRPQWLDLMFLTAEPLQNPVRPFPPEPRVLTTGLPIARREDGKPWRLKLVGSHLLLVGSTGAGKSGVLWAIIHALVPAIEDGLVKLWVADPKGGMELAGARQWFDRFAYGSRPAIFANLLDEAVQVMQARQAALLGVAQLHKPSVAQPLYVVVVDEIAALTAWSTDRDAQKRINTALHLLLSQGRAVGVIVIGAVQDPRKETLPMRGLFTIRIALRLNEARDVESTLGPGARERGAKCDQIPPSLPGVGYVMIDGEPDPTRVRFAHVTEQMLGNTKGELPEMMAAEPVETGIFIA
jgi:S-DNA-T family DNA segregation ATPase FtsK/SpoIIIE